MTWSQDAPLVLSGYQDTSPPVTLSESEVSYLTVELPKRVNFSVFPLRLFRVRGGTKIQQRGVAGAIALPSGRLIHLEPTFGSQNFIYLWLYAQDFSHRYIGGLSVPSSPDAAVIDAFGHVFTAELGKLIQNGPRRQYREWTQVTTQPKGQVLLQSQVRRKPPHLDLLCRERRRTYDTPLNRGICRAAHILLQMITIPEIRNRLDRNLRSFKDYVSTSEVSLSEFDSVELTRLEHEYSRIYPMAQQVLHNSYHGNLWSGDSTYSCTVFVRMSTVFERAVQRAFAVAAKEHELMTKDEDTFTGYLTGGRFVMIPDITVLDGKNPIAVIDAKFKSLDNKPVNADLYQISTYQNALAVPGMLVYPEQSLSHDRYVVDGAYPLHAAQFPIGSPYPSFQTFVDAIEEWAFDALEQLLSEH